MSPCAKGLHDVILGRYVIDDIFERSALIYVVHDRENPSFRLVAKRVRPEHLRTQEVHDWFSREADIWQKVSAHPSMVRLIHPLRYDTSDGVQYFFIEFVDGHSLDHILRQSPNKRLSLMQSLRWAVQVASAMEHATMRERNGHGVFIHRDLDASNILVGKSCAAKVSDWGLGKNVDEADDQIFMSSIQNIKRGAAGKAPFMPPEQFPPGKGRDYKVAGDIYYFGGLLYIMLTGRFVNPYHESMALQQSARTEEEVMRCLEAHQQKSVRQYLQEYVKCPGLEELILECISVRAGERPSSFSEILLRLRRLARDLARNAPHADYFQCESCSFLANEEQTTCPVCERTYRFKPCADPYHAAGLDKVAAEEAPVAPLATTPSLHPPQDPYASPLPPTKPLAPAHTPFGIDSPDAVPIPPFPPAASVPPHAAASRVSNPLIQIPAGVAVLGARQDMLAWMSRAYGVTGSRLEQWSQWESRTARLPGFELAQMAVSNEEYLEFVEATGWRRPTHWTGRQGRPFAHGEADLPVVNVDFADAQTFCQWRGVRLPTNDEWERAARGPRGHVYPWGDQWADRSSSPARARCNTLERHQITGQELASVRDFQEFASPEGFLNMAGNAWEWVDGGEGDRKHTRGGSWRYQGDVYTILWFRLPTDPEIKHDDVGFRYARDLGGGARGARGAQGVVGAAGTRPRSDLEEFASIAPGNYRVGIEPSRMRDLARQFELTEHDMRILSLNPWRAVRLQRLEIRKHLVTNEEYYQFAKTTGYPWPSHWMRELLGWSDRPFLDFYRYHPVTNVSFRDATAYCSWRGGRLAKSEEWEVAARGEAGRLYPWGDTYYEECANVLETGLARTSPAGQFEAGVSPSGCFDMAGNVQEWVAPDSSGQYVVRGGSYRTKGPLYALASLCIPAESEITRPDVGFRFVLDA